MRVFVLGLACVVFRTSWSPCVDPSSFVSTVVLGTALALGYIARHSKDLAQTVVDAGAVPLLVLLPICDAKSRKQSQHTS